MAAIIPVNGSSPVASRTSNLDPKSLKIRLEESWLVIPYVADEELYTPEETTDFSRDEVDVVVAADFGYFELLAEW